MIKKFSVSLLAVSFLFTAGRVNASELRLGMTEKQQYIGNKIYNTLHPAEDFKPYEFKAPEGWSLEKLTLGNVSVERLKSDNKIFILLHLKTLLVFIKNCSHLGLSLKI